MHSTIDIVLIAVNISHLCAGHNVSSGDNVPDLIGPNERVSMEEINKQLVSDCYLQHIV